MSLSGSRSITTKSASRPGLMDPVRFSTPMHSAETEVAALIASIGGIPIATSSITSCGIRRLLFGP